MGKFLVKSHAKINIAINVLDKKENGYHELDSIMVPLELHDSLIVSEHYKNENFVTIDDFSFNFSDYNITSLAIDALAAKYGFKNRYRVSIHKVIPIKANCDCPLQPCLWERRQTTCESLDCLKLSASQIVETILK